MVIGLSVGSLQATPLKKAAAKTPFVFCRGYLGVAVAERAAKRLKGHSRVANLCGVSHDQMAKVELYEAW